MRNESKQMIGQSVLHYEIIEKLGEGGMGVVYLAEDKKLERKVAIKFLPSNIITDIKERERFKIEARAVASLNHTNISTIYSIEETAEQLFIVMEYIQGKALKSIIDLHTNHYLSINDIIEYTVQIAEGLRTAHDKGIVHCDIKSSNIMISNEGKVKIMDFGLAKVKGGMQLTRIGTTKGTISYMSPEQALGKEVDHRTDIWSLGIVIYEMLTGQLPFRSEYEQAVIYSIVNEKPQNPYIIRSKIPKKLDAILNKCLTKKAKERYQNVDELFEDLTRLQKTGTSIFKGWKYPKKNNRRFVLSVFVLLILIFVFYYLIRNTDSNNKTDLTTENSLAVMYFENQSGEKDIDKVLVSMLTTNLARYKDLNVISSQRLFDILKSLGKQNTSSINITDATEVANHAKVKKILTGSVIKIGSTIRINAQLLDVASGKIINSYQEDGYKIEDIFLMVDDLTEKIQGNFNMPDLVTGTQRLKIKDVTTSSIEAYKYYEKGLEKLWRWEVDNAAENFKKAVEIDSTFAIAYLQLAVSKTNNSLYVIAPFADINPIRELLNHADRYSFKATDKEKWLIHVNKKLFDREFYSADSLAEKFVENYPDDREANQLFAFTSWFVGNNDQCINSAERVLEIDPTFIGAYGMLAYLYSSTGDNKHAISSIKKAIALQHADNDYDTAFEIYLQANEPEEALHLCETIEKAKGVPYYYLAYIYMLDGNGEKSREEYNKEIENDPKSKSYVSSEIACAFAYEGRYSEAAAEFKKCIEQAKLSKSFWLEMYSYFNLGKIFLAQGNRKEALESFSQGEKASKFIFTGMFDPAPIISAYYCGLVYVKDADFKSAELAGEKIKFLIKTNHLDSSFMDFYYLLSGEIYLARNNPHSASDAVSKLTPFTKMFPRRQILIAKVEALKGNADKAEQVLKKFRDTVPMKNSYMGGDNLDFLIGRSHVNYNIAKLFEKKGDKSKAINYFSKAIGEWKHADNKMSELIDAKLQLAKLSH